jgi:arylsulfatase A-like enzyme
LPLSGRAAAILVCAIVGVGCAAPTSAPTPPPNILLIIADDHAYQAISSYGSILNETPNIDRIAAEGIRFDRALVTNSICAPSRAVILTGRYSHSNGVLDNVLEFDGAQPTFPALLQQAGYQTAAFGKWHLKSEPVGFDQWEVLPGQGHYYNPDLRTPEGTVRRTGYVTDIVTDLTLEWLSNERDADRPFFVWLGHKAPHRNWMPGPAHLTTYADTTFPEPPTLFDDYSGRAAGAATQEMEIDRHMSLMYDLKVRPAGAATQDWERNFWTGMDERMNGGQRAAWDAAYGPRNEAFLAAPPSGAELVRWKYQEYLKDYLRTIASVDDNVGRVLDYLDESGLADNTLVVYTSDQGFYLGEHGWYDKRWIYEESVRTPLLMRLPGTVAAGADNSDLVANLDLAPTFLDLAGARIPAPMQGRSLRPILDGTATAPLRLGLYYHYYESEGPHAVPVHYGVITDRYKLVRYPELDEWELFERESDPNEIQNRYSDEALADTRERLTAELDRLRAELGVPADSAAGPEQP